VLALLAVLPIACGAAVAFYFWIAGGIAEVVRVRHEHYPSTDIPAVRASSATDNGFSFEAGSATGSFALPAPPVAHFVLA